MARIALYIPSLQGGGAERVMVYLANGFTAAGHEVDLVLVKAQGPYLADLSKDVRVVDLKAARVGTSLIPLMSYLKKSKPDVLLSAMGYVNVMAVAAKILARVATRVVVSEHGNLGLMSRSGSGLSGRLVIPLMRWAYPRSDAVVAVSSGVAEDLVRVIGLPMNNVKVVYNPAIPPLLTSLASAPVNHPWFDPGSPPVILSAGRLAPEKDFVTLIKAFSIVRKNYGVRLLILGEGGARSALEQLVGELGLTSDVCLHGFVDNPYSYMKRSALFVLSSTMEAFGNVLVEAMACGTPVVSTATSGPSEILEFGKWGELVPVGDVSAMATAMMETLEKKLHPEVAHRAARFNSENAVAGYARIMMPDR